MSDLDSVRRDECALCHERGHWKDCLKLKDKSKHQTEPSDSNAKFVPEQGDSFDSNVYLSVTLFAMYTNDTYWILDTGTTYHICPERE